MQNSINKKVALMKEGGGSGAFGFARIGINVRTAGRARHLPSGDQPRRWVGAELDGQVRLPMDGSDFQCPLL